MTKLEGPSHGPQAGGRPGHLIVLVHGYGADGNDLIGLAPVLAPLMPDTVFHAPNAPHRCDENPTGYQWFGLARFDPHRLAEGVRSATPYLDAFLDKTMAAYGLDESKTALVGFSQGTMMSLHVGLRRAKPLAGIVGFSGALAAPEALAAEIRTRPPVLLLHGDSDPLIPSAMSERAAEVLRRNGVQVGLHIAQGVGHGIDQTGLGHAARFLLDAFKLPLPKQGN